MLIGPFHVGDKPADALDLQVSRPGDDTPLSGFTACQFELMPPDRVLVSWAGALVQPDIARTTWQTAFTQAGLHRVRAKLTGPGSIQEYTGWVRFWVRP